MSSFYKMDPAAWDFGTTNLSLEEEAAYLRIVNAIHKHDQPLPDNDRVLAGMFRCSTRKARALVAALVKAGKVRIEGGAVSAVWRSPVREAIPALVRQEVAERSSHTCVYCGGDGPFEIDHIVPWSRGGTSDPENLALSCRACNRTKAARTPEEMGWVQ